MGLDVDVARFPLILEPKRSRGAPVRISKRQIPAQKACILQICLILLIVCHCAQEEWKKLEAQVGEDKLAVVPINFALMCKSSLGSHF